MGQKINPSVFNLAEKNNKQSKYIEKKLSDYSFYSKADLEIKNFTKIFFKNYKIIINNCKLLYLTNLLYVYISYYQKASYVILEPKKTQIIKSCFNHKKNYIRSKQPKNFIKKSFNENLKFIKGCKKIKNLRKNPRIKAIKNLELITFIENFFISLTMFISKRFNIFLTLERQNTKIILLKKKRVTWKEKTAIIKKKQKLISLRKYKQNTFFKEGVSTLLSCIVNKNSSKLIAQYIATQLKILKHHNFFIRFIKDTLLILSDKIFLSIIKGIKIEIKGRFNGRPRAQNRVIQILCTPPVLTKSVKIDYFEEISFTLNGTFGIKVWIYQV